MTIVSQNAGKQGFFVISGRNSGEFRRAGRLFLKKQSQFPGARMNVNVSFTEDYENKSAFGVGENKANSKPNAGRWPEARSTEP